MTEVTSLNNLRQPQARLLRPTEVIQLDALGSIEPCSKCSTLASRIDEESPIYSISEFLEQTDTFSLGQIVGVEGYVEYAGEDELMLEPVSWPWEHQESMIQHQSVPPKFYYYRLHESLELESKLSLIFAWHERLVNRERVVVPHCVSDEESMSPMIAHFFK